MNVHDEANAVLKGQIDSLKKQIEMLRLDSKNHQEFIDNDSYSIDVLEQRIAKLHESQIALDNLIKDATL